MIHNRVLAAGVIFCLLFACIVSILVTDQNNIVNFFPVFQNSTNSSMAPDSPIIAASDNLSKGEIPPGNSLKETGKTGTGVIIYEELEGGFFGILSDDGQRFIPDSLPSDLRINGTRVIFSLREKPDTMSVHMWGMPASIVSVQTASRREISSNAPLVTFERAGGIADGYESLVIDPDGRGEIQSPAGITRIIINVTDLDDISRTINTSVFSHLDPEYLPVRSRPDAVIYTITIGNTSVKMTDDEAPLQVKPLVFKLLEILYKYLETEGSGLSSAE